MKILRYESIVAVVLLAAAIGFSSCSRGGKMASISVTPANPTIATGTKQQFTAVATFSDGTTIDWTTAAAWSTSGAAVTIGNSLGSYGLASATSLLSGTTNTITITATDTVNNISGTATLYITDPQSIAITPPNPFMAIGTAHQFTATATLLLSDLTNTTTQNLTSFAAWTTINSVIATVSSPGLITAGTTTGQTNILVSAPTGTSDTTTLTVTDTSLASITVTPTNPSISIAITPTLQFTATGNYPTGTPTAQSFTQSVIWSSSNTGVATISNTAGSNGLATIVSTSTTPITITATDPITGVAGITTLTVNP